MKFLFSLSLILTLTLVQFSPAFAQSCSSSAGLWPQKKSIAFAEKLVSKMTIEEKVGQLVHVGINAKFANQDSPFFKDLQRQVAENKIGGIIFFGAPIYETTILGNRMQAIAKTPLLLSLLRQTHLQRKFWIECHPQRAPSS